MRPGDGGFCGSLPAFAGGVPEEIMQLVYLGASGDFEGEGGIEGNFLFEEEDAVLKDQLIMHHF